MLLKEKNKSQAHDELCPRAHRMPRHGSMTCINNLQGYHDYPDYFIIYIKASTSVTDVRPKKYIWRNGEERNRDLRLVTLVHPYESRFLVTSQYQKHILRPLQVHLVNTLSNHSRATSVLC